MRRPVRFATPRLALCALALGGGALVGCGGGAPPAEDPAVFEAPVDQELVVRAARNAMRYETTRIEARAGTRVRLIVDNTRSTSPAMLHNAVVLRSREAVFPVGQAAAREPDHVPDDPAILAATPLAAPRGRAAVVFTVPPPGEYPFICTYPGHFTTMQGTLVSTP